MTAYGKSLEKTTDTSPNIGVGFSLVQSIEDSRKCMRDKYASGLVSDIQLQDFECSLDAMFADYQDNHEKSAKELQVAREAVCCDSKAKSALLRQETGTLWDVLSKVRSLKNLPKDMLVGEAKGISKGATAVYEGAEKLLVGTGEFIGVWAAKWVHEWGDSFLGYANEKTQNIREAVRIAGEAIAITAFEAVNGDRSVIRGAIRYWGEKGVRLSQLPPEKQIATLYAFQTQIALGMAGSSGLWAISKTSALSWEIQTGGKVLTRAVSGGARIGTEALGLDSGVLKRGSVQDIHPIWSSGDAVSSGGGNYRDTAHSSRETTDVPAHQINVPSALIHEIQGTTLILKDIPPLAPKDLEKALIQIMRDNPVDSIRFDNSLSSEAKQALSTIMSKNHPLVEVVRLIPGNDVVNITFAGIKKLNDTFGQAFVDRFMDSVRERINGTFHTYTSNIEKSGTHAHARGIRTDDYKNFTVSLPPDAPLESVLFSGADSKYAFTQEMIDHARQDIEKIAREKGKTPKEVEDIMRTHLNFGVGKSSVPEGASDMDKLHAFYEAEMNSRKGLETDGIEATLSDQERVVQYAREAMNQKADILNNWKGKWFTFEWVEYPAVIPTFGTNKLVLHPQLMRQVRKWPEAVMPPELAGAVRTYIDTLNNGFDFIAPTHNPEEDFRKAHAFNADFQNGIIKPEAILQTYKGTLTKEAFFGLTEGKPGMRAMIDIKDMGLDNLASFDRIAEKVASGKYIQEDLLGAGKEVTEQFITFTDFVRRNPISLGGDEVYLLFEGAKPGETEAILTSLHKNLGKSSLEGRVSHSFDSQNSRELFEWLDTSMNLHKKVEASIEEVLSRNLASANPHKTISVHVNEGVPMETNLLGIIKGVWVQNMIEIMMQSIREGNTLIHETLKLSDGVNLKCDYDDGMFRFVFNP